MLSPEGLAARKEQRAEQEAELYSERDERDEARATARATARARILHEAAIILAIEAGRRGRTVTPTLDQWCDDGIAIVDDDSPLGQNSPPDLEALWHLVADETKHGFDSAAQAAAMNSAGRAGRTMSSLRPVAAKLYKFLRDAVEAWGIAELPVDVRAQAARCAGLGRASAKNKAVASSIGKLRFEDHSEWDSGLIWLVDGLLQTTGVGLWFADPGAGKTLLAIELASSVATGRPFAGRTVRTGAVLYACVDAPRSTKRRLAALPLETKRRIKVIPELSVPDDLEELAQHLIKRRLEGDPVRLVIFDTWDSVRAQSGGGYTAEDKAANEQLSAIRKICDRLELACLILHHSTKNQDSPSSRGTLVLKAKLDLECHLTKVAEGVIGLRTTKARDGEEGDVGSWRIVAQPHPTGGNPTPVLQFLDGAMAVAGAQAMANAAREAKAKDDRLRVLQGLASAPRDGRTKKSMAALITMDASRWYRLIRGLRKDGLVESLKFHLTAAGQIAAQSGSEVAPWPQNPECQLNQ